MPHNPAVCVYASGFNDSAVGNQTLRHVPVNRMQSPSAVGNVMVTIASVNQVVQLCWTYSTRHALMLVQYWHSCNLNIQVLKQVIDDK